MELHARGQLTNEALSWCDWSGRTPLMLAAMRNDGISAKVLIGYGADVNAINPAVDATGGTALHEATRNRHEALAELLLSNGANPFQCNAVGKHCLDEAVRSGSVYLIRRYEQLAYINSEVAIKTTKMGGLKQPWKPFRLVAMPVFPFFNRPHTDASLKGGPRTRTQLWVYKGGTVTLPVSRLYLDNAMVDRHSPVELTLKLDPTHAPFPGEFAMPKDASGRTCLSLRSVDGTKETSQGLDALTAVVHGQVTLPIEQQQQQAAAAAAMAAGLMMGGSMGGGGGKLLPEGAMPIPSVLGGGSAGGAYHPYHSMPPVVLGPHYPHGMPYMGAYQSMPAGLGPPPSAALFAPAAAGAAAAPATAPAAGAASGSVGGAAAGGASAGAAAAAAADGAAAAGTSAGGVAAAATASAAAVAATMAASLAAITPHRHLTTSASTSQASASSSAAAAAAAAASSSSSSMQRSATSRYDSLGPGPLTRGVHMWGGASVLIPPQGSHDASASVSPYPPIPLAGSKSTVSNGKASSLLSDEEIAAYQPPPPPAMYAAKAGEALSVGGLAAALPPIDDAGDGQQGGGAASSSGAAAAAARAEEDGEARAVEGAAEAPPVVTAARLLQMMPSMREEDFGEDGACVVCLSRPREAGFLHGETVHRCVCRGCAAQFRRPGAQCPLCRATVERIIASVF